MDLIVDDTVGQTWFNKEYQSASLWWGLGIVNLLANLGMAMYLPGWIKYGDYKWLKERKNFWTRQAWGWMIGGNYWWYYLIGCVWLFAWIRKPFQLKALFWSMIVGQAIAWVSMIWINVCMLVGGVTDGGSWENLYLPLIYDAFFFGFNAIDYYLLLPKYSAFYRW